MELEVSKIQALKVQVSNIKISKVQVLKVHISNVELPKVYVLDIQILDIHISDVLVHVSIFQEMATIHVSKDPITNVNETIKAP